MRRLSLLPPPTCSLKGRQRGGPKTMHKHSSPSSRLLQSTTGTSPTSTRKVSDKMA